MVKCTQKIRRPKLTKCLSMCDHFVGLALKGLIKLVNKGIQDIDVKLRDSYYIVNPLVPDVH